MFKTRIKKIKQNISIMHEIDQSKSVTFLTQSRSATLWERLGKRTELPRGKLGVTAYKKSKIESILESKKKIIINN